jgi:hypothetical protein
MITADALLRRAERLAKEQAESNETVFAYQSKICPLCAKDLKTTFFGYWVFCKPCNKKWPVPSYP